MLKLRKDHQLARKTVSATCDGQVDSVRQVEVDERGALRTAQGKAIDAIAITQGYCNAKQREYNATGLRCNAMRSQCGAEATRLQRKHMLSHPDRNALQDNFDCSAIAMQCNAFAMRGKTMRRSDCEATRCDCDALLQSFTTQVIYNAKAIDKQTSSTT